MELYLRTPVSEKPQVHHYFHYRDGFFGRGFYGVVCGGYIPNNEHMVRVSVEDNILGRDFVGEFLNTAVEKEFHRLANAMTPQDIIVKKIENFQVQFSHNVEQYKTLVGIFMKTYESNFR